MAAACRVVVVVVMLLGAAVSGGMARAQDTGAADVACGLNQRITQRAPGGGWVISRPNAFNTSGQRLCISGSTSHPGFTILDNLRFTGAWQAYPFTGAGCAFQLCSPYTELPIQVRELPAPANTSFSWTGSAPGNWNVSYDIWFDHHNQITTQDDGAELMIWLRPNPGYRGGVRVHISNRWYWFMHWQTCNSARQMGVTPPRVSLANRAGTCWDYVQFRFPTVVHNVRRLWIMPFIRFLEKQGLVRPSWWLTSVHAGYELVSGGKGLTTTGFNVDHLTRPWSTRQASQAAAQPRGRCVLQGGRHHPGPPVVRPAPGLARARLHGEPGGQRSAIGDHLGFRHARCLLAGRRRRPVAPVHEPQRVERAVSPEHGDARRAAQGGGTARRHRGRVLARRRRSPLVRHVRPSHRLVVRAQPRRRPGLRPGARRLVPGHLRRVLAGHRRQPVARLPDPRPRLARTGEPGDGTPGRRTGGDRPAQRRRGRVLAWHR